MLKCREWGIFKFCRFFYTNSFGELDPLLIITPYPQFSFANNTFQKKSFSKQNATSPIYFDFNVLISILNPPNSVELLEALNSRKNLKTEDIVHALSKADDTTCT